MRNDPQTYANHRALPSNLYIAAFLVLTVNVVWQIILAVRAPAFGTILGILVALALVAVMLTSRRSPQIVQDRLIRLEMRGRLARVLPPERHGDIERLSLPQLVGLRFASDGELPALVQEAVAQSLSNNDIKRRITAWQADWLRV